MLFWLWPETAIGDWWLQSITGAQTFAERRNTFSDVLAHIIKSLFPKPGQIWAADGS